MMTIEKNTVKTNRMKYTQAGVRTVNAGSDFRFSGNVFVADGNISAESPNDIFCSNDSGMPKRKRPVSFTWKKALTLLAALFLIFSTVICVKAVQISDMKTELARLKSDTTGLRYKNEDLLGQIREETDPAHICYKAVQELGMVNSLGADTVYLTVNANGTVTAERSNGNRVIQTGSR